MNATVTRLHAPLPRTAHAVLADLTAARAAVRTLEGELAVHCAAEARRQRIPFLREQAFEAALRAQQDRSA